MVSSETVYKTKKCLVKSGKDKSPPRRAESTSVPCGAYLSTCRRVLEYSPQGTTQDSARRPSAARDERTGKGDGIPPHGDAPGAPFCSDSVIKPLGAACPASDNDLRQANGKRRKAVWATRQRAKRGRKTNASRSHSPSASPNRYRYKQTKYLRQSHPRYDLSST